jgi:hypothetical protein
MAASRTLLERQELLGLVRELRKVETAAPIDPELQPLEVVDSIEAYEREHTSGSVLGG